jgi:hypothetical protein
VVSHARLEPTMNKYATFLYAYAQVSLIALNTWQIANGEIVGALIVGFLISLTWTFNVRRAAFGDAWTRLIYCTGAMFGTGTGIFLSQVFYG